MLIDDPEVAINEVIIACQECADHYDDSGNLIENESIRQLCQKLGERRRQFADQLADLIREQGGLPRQVDTEQEQLQILWSHLKLAFSTVDYRTLLNEMINHENNLKTAADNALVLELESSRAVVEQVQKDSAAALARFHEILGEHAD